MSRLAKDYIKYLFGGNKSARLRRAMYKWGRFYKKLTQKKKTDPMWLEKAIINTETWWDSPEKYRRLARALESNSDQEQWIQLYHPAFCSDYCIFCRCCKMVSVFGKIYMNDVLLFRHVESYMAKFCDYK